MEVELWLMATVLLLPVPWLSTPVTVTVWAVFQLAEVKVKVAGLTVAIAVLPDATAICTLAEGRVASATV